MSINHFSSSSSSSSELNLPPTPSLWWPPQHQHHLSSNNNFMEEDQASNLSSSSSLPFHYPPNYHHTPTTTSWLKPYTNPAPPPPPGLDLNVENDAVTAREHLFEKPLTPSDVGKLNRLVIPKQHAERYFPLGGEAGLVLGFEDETGKAWKFRYSYWNSSQSYVLTKGWSRYVKEKQLDSGDVVLFQRLRDRLFIGWRRRGDSNNNCTGVSGSPVAAMGRGGPTAARGISCSSSSIANNNNNEFPRPGTMAQDQSTSIVNPKRLRLFGVNLECQVDDQSSEPSTPDGSSMSSHGLTHHHHHQFYSSQQAYSYSSNSPSHMDGITFSQDVNQMRNRRG